jgi:hypothetical protein
VMKSLKRAVHVLHLLSTSAVLGEAVGLVSQKALNCVPMVTGAYLHMRSRSHPLGRSSPALPFCFPYVSSSL